jgi:hypothetical protein
MAVAPTAVSIKRKGVVDNKLAELCDVMEIHLLTLMTLAYGSDERCPAPNRIRRELEPLLSTTRKTADD